MARFHNMMLGIAAEGLPSMGGTAQQWRASNIPQSCRSYCVLS